MIAIRVADYSSFKSAITTIGGPTPVIFYTSVSGTKGFIVVATFQIFTEIILFTALNTQPATLVTDFPKALKVNQILIDGLIRNDNVAMIGN